MVAGTSGAGKSELLQTWVAALALANTPEQLSIIFMDYKGGAAFAEAAEALAGGDILSACELLNGILEADVALAESAVSKFEAAWQEALQ